MRDFLPVQTFEVILKGLAELVLSLCDLVEAEGRLLKQGVNRTGRGCVLSAIALLFIGAALAFVIAAIYEALAGIVPRPVAFLVLAAACALTAFVVLWSAQKCIKKRPKKNGK